MSPRRDLPPPGTKRVLTPAMRTTLIAVAGLIVVVTLVSVLPLLFTGPPTATGSRQTDSHQTASATAGPGSGHDSPPSVSPTAVTEAQPRTPTKPPPKAGQPAPPVPTPLVAAPLPSGSANGRLVDGFPASVIGPAPGSDVVSSSIATEGGTMQVTLVARTDASAADIRAHFQQRWAALGLTAAGPAAAGVAYSDPFTALTLAFSSASGTGTLYTVYGVFRTS